MFVQKRSLQSNGDEFDKENNDVLFNAVKMLDSLILRMIKCDPEDFELVSYSWKMLVSPLHQMTAHNFGWLETNMRAPLAAYLFKIGDHHNLAK